MRAVTISSAVVAALAIAVMLALPLSRDIPLNTWSIVALDPETGEVGIAGASCVPVRIDAIAALVPGRGAATAQGAFNVHNRDVALLALQEGQDAVAVLTTTAPPADQWPRKPGQPTKRPLW